MMRRALIAIALVLSSLITLLATSDAHAVSLDNFVITNYAADMQLSSDEKNRSHLEVTETITADFQRSNTNHGLERVFVKKYDNHSTNFKLVSITDEKGNNQPFHWSGDALRIGEKDSYVNGVKTYKIKYTQRDVTKFYQDTNKDEFFWDVLGVEWRVPIQSATIHLTLSQELTSDSSYCYYGQSGSTTQCTLENASNGYSVTQKDLSPGSGITLAIGFPAKTFAAYEMSLVDKLQAWIIVSTVVGSVIAFGLVVWVSVKISRWSGRRHEIGTIIPEYLPPKESSVTTSASLLRTAGLLKTVNATMSAQLIDLAVRRYVKLYEVKEKKWYRAAEFDVEVIKDLGDLRWEERELISDMFDSIEVGKRMNLKELRNNSSYFARTTNNDTELEKRLRSEYALKEPYDAPKKLLKRTGAFSFGIGIVVLSIPLAVVGLLLLLASLFTYHRLTDKGKELNRYLEGLKMYISVAEQDRLRLLQSPEGAEKVGDSSTDAKRVVLYERVLPYAVLFGQEKQWAKQLADYYAQTQSQPGWYNGHSGIFTAATFSSSINGLSTAASSASSSSSSSGGSSGGGSSGGGGGGGGGGGW